MKKILIGTVMTVMILAGCRADGGDMDNNSGTIPEYQGTQIVETTADAQPLESTEQETQGNVKAEFSHDTIYISLELPADWDYEIVEYDETQETCGIVFGPAEREDLRYELFYHSMYGICGTGVTIEELQLENGTNIWRYSETIQGMLWRNIVFEYEKDADERGSYVLSYSADEKLVMEYEEKLQEIMETVVVGSRKD